MRRESRETTTVKAQGGCCESKVKSSDCVGAVGDSEWHPLKQHDRIAALRLNPHPSLSTPTKMTNVPLGIPAQSDFLLEVEQARNDLDRFRNEMKGLARQIDTIDTDLRLSGNRVLAIERDLTQTQETNVNLQIRLENAVTQQKESSVFATRAMRHIHSDLALVAYESSQLRGRLAVLANHQKTHQGSVDATGERMREYMRMLEQAQGAIQKLQPTLCHDRRPNHTTETIANSLAGGRPHGNSGISPEIAELYRHRIIRKRASLHGMKPLVHTRSRTANPSLDRQEGLRLLLPSPFYMTECSMASSLGTVRGMKVNI